jgi:hypothetical protein
LFIEVGGLSRRVFWPLVTEADGVTVKKPHIYIWNAISMVLLTGAVDYLAISFQVRTSRLAPVLLSLQRR